MSINWRSFTVITTLMLSAVGIAAVQSQEKQSSGSQITIPDGEPAQMLTAMKAAMPRVRTPADYEALVQVADKIVTHAQSTDAQKKEARAFAIQLLYRGSMLNEKELGPKFEAYTAKLKQEAPGTELAATASAFLWARKYIKSGEVDDAGVTELWQLQKAHPKHDLVPQLFTVAGRMIKDDQKAVAFMKQAMETYGKESPIGKQFETLIFQRELTGKELEIIGPTLKGESFNISALKGKVVLVDYWATWCGPCVMELPNVKTVYDKYHDKGFEIVAISLDQKKEDLEKFITDRKLPWTQIIFAEEKDMGWNNPLARKYKVNSIPATFLIGRDGKVVGRDLRGPALEKAVAEQIEKSKPASP